MEKTNIDDFIEELGAGVIKEKVAHVLSEAALATILHGHGKRVGKVGVQLTFTQVGENDQVIVTAKITQSIPTKRGKTTMEDATDTPMFVGKGGILTINAPRYNEDGQFNLTSDDDDKVTGINRRTTAKSEK